MTDLYQFLSANGIDYQRFDHPPVYTVEDVYRLTPDLPGSKTKNLFLRDRKGKRHFLVVAGDEKRVNLKALSGVIDAKGLSFASADRLQKFLGVEPGAVSLLAAFNDQDHCVEIYIDQELWAAEAFQFHPLVNTSTLVINREGIQKFLDAAGHAAKVVEVPE